MVAAFIQLAISLEIFEGQKEVESQLDNFYFQEEKEFVVDFYQAIAEESKRIIQNLHIDRPLVEQLKLKIEEQENLIRDLEGEVGKLN